MKPLGQELAELEKTDPAVAAAAKSYDETVERIVSGAMDRGHSIPCTRPDCEWHRA